jgi:hypothetical protein
VAVDNIYNINYNSTGLINIIENDYDIDSGDVIHINQIIS